MRRCQSYGIGVVLMFWIKLIEAFAKCWFVVFHNLTIPIIIVIIIIHVSSSILHTFPHQVYSVLGLLMVGTFKIERDRLVRLVMFVLFDLYAICIQCLSDEFMRRLVRGISRSHGRIGKAGFVVCLIIEISMLRIFSI